MILEVLTINNLSVLLWLVMMAGATIHYAITIWAWGRRYRYPHDHDRVVADATLIFLLALDGIGVLTRITDDGGGASSLTLSILPVRFLAILVVWMLVIWDIGRERERRDGA